MYAATTVVMDWMVDPEKKNSRLYARAALERMQQAHRLSEIFYLRQDEILEIGGVAHERVGRRHALHGGVEPGKALVGDSRGDLRAVAPRERVLVRHQHLAGLTDGRGDRFPVHGRETAQIEHFDAHAVLLLELLRRDERALHDGAVRHDRQLSSLAYALRLAERDHEVGAGVGRLI